MSTALDAKAAMDAAAAAGNPLPDYIQNLINGQIAAIQAIVPMLETQQPTEEPPPPDEPPPE
jgi:hypothetical protein